jgi:UDP-2,4-diacetamido-2,4,6-trideoxy-beta-L-altropyranose hydrolase
MKKLAIFRFEASPTIGAGHAIRSCVLADALVEEGWVCKIATTLTTYNFIPKMDRFERIDPEDFYNTPVTCDLLVVDNYELDQVYEGHFRPYAKKILVIDDLANRMHDCDILLDQTYGRDADDYKNLVPQRCKVLAGSDYVLLRKEFAMLRPKALEKRRKTTEVKRILISMGGSDSQNYTLKALKMIEKSEFTGAIDIVLGFTSTNTESVKNYISSLPNECVIHVNANTPKLMYEADLAIGAAGTSVWERCCLGLPQYLFQIAENQSDTIKKFTHSDFMTFYLATNTAYQEYVSFRNIDGLGVLRFMCYINPTYGKADDSITHARVCEEDVDLIFKWQQNSELRRFSFNQESPSYEGHKKWFREKLEGSSVFEKIIANEVPCGALRLDYCFEDNSWKLSWYILPEFQKKGIGTIALNFSKKLAVGKTVNAFVFKENISSQKAMKKAEFKLINNDQNGFYYAH